MFVLLLGSHNRVFTCTPASKFEPHNLFFSRSHGRRPGQIYPVDKFTGILLSLLFFFHFYQFSKNSRMKKLDDDGGGGLKV
jgi:hypothetical protein